MANVTVTVDSGITVDVVDKAVADAATQALKDQVAALTAQVTNLQGIINTVKAAVNV